MFFFQAEDGIRDVAVTGVQTCALPISCGTASGGTSLVRGGRETGRARAITLSLGSLRRRANAARSGGQRSFAGSGKALGAGIGRALFHSFASTLSRGKSRSSPRPHFV